MSENGIGRKKPAGWDDLVTLAEQVNGDADSITPLAETVHAMDMTTIDFHRYYAFAGVVCKFAQQLPRPGVKEEIVSSGTAILLESYESKGSFEGLNDTSIFAPVFQPVAESSMQQVNPAHRTIGDILCLTRDKRINKQAIFDTAIANECFMPSGTESPFQRDFQRSVAAGATLVAAKILYKGMGERLSSRLPSEEEVAVLHHPSAVKAAQQACALRIAETSLSSYVSVQNGTVVYTNPKPERKVRTEVSAPKPIEEQTRDERRYRVGVIICPAAHVNGTVPLVFGSVAEMIGRTLDQIKT